MSGGDRIPLVTAASELPEPVPEAQVSPSLTKRGEIASEQPFQRALNGARFGERENVAGNDEAAIRVGATAARKALVDDRDRPARFRQIVSGRRSDHSGNRSQPPMGCLRTRRSDQPFRA